MRYLRTAKRAACFFDRWLAERLQLDNQQLPRWVATRALALQHGQRPADTGPTATARCINHLQSELISSSEVTMRFSTASRLFFRISARVTMDEIATPSAESCTSPCSERKRCYAQNIRFNNEGGKHDDTNREGRCMVLKHSECTTTWYHWKANPQK